MTESSVSGRKPDTDEEAAERASREKVDRNVDSDDDKVDLLTQVIVGRFAAAFRALAIAAAAHQVPPIAGRLAKAGTFRAGLSRGEWAARLGDTGEIPRSR